MLFHSCLWGNRADLSHLTVREQVRGGMAARQELHNLIIGDTAKVGEVLSDWLINGKRELIHYISS